MNKIFRFHLSRHILWFCLLSFFLSSCRGIFLSKDKAYSKAIATKPYDAIIVPGFPYFEGQPWPPVVQMRMIWAKFLYQNGYTKNIIFSGNAVYSPFVEGKTMKAFAIAMGIPEEHIYVEDKAEHSVENVYYSYRLAKKLGFKKIALATDPVQTRSMVSFVHRFSLPISYLPIMYKTLRLLPHSEPDIDGKLQRVENFISLPEKETFKQRFAGTLGKNIKWHAEDLKKKRLRKKYSHNIVQE